MTSPITVYHTFKLTGWDDNGNSGEPDSPHIGIYVVSREEEALKAEEPLIIETSHGYNGTEAAHTLLGLDIVDTAPTLEHGGIVYRKIYSPSGMTPMNLDQLLIGFPKIVPSEGFINSMTRRLERTKELVADSQGSRSELKRQRLEKRAAKRAALSTAEPTNVNRPPRPQRPETEDNDVEVTDIGGSVFTHSYVDNLTAKAALAQIVRKAGTNDVDATITCRSTVCKYIDPASGKKKAFDGARNFTDAKITDLGRVWMTVVGLEEAFNGGKPVTWFLKVVTLGSLITFTVGEKQ